MSNNQEKKSNIINRLSSSITQNPIQSILIALSLIGLGIILDYTLVNYNFEKHSIYNIIIKVISRLFISLGEATFVFILLQISIETKITEQHLDIAKTALDDFSKKIESAASTTLKAINDKTFQSFLDRYYPESFSGKLINENFFKFDVLRTETLWIYKIKKNSENKIELIQEIYYTVLNLRNETISHDIRLETFKTYENEADILKVVINNDGESPKIIEGDDLKAVINTPNSDGKQVFCQKTEIPGKKHIKIEKVVKNIYSDKKITDFHYPTEHTMDLRIKVQFLENLKDIDFNITVPFLNNNENLMKNSSTKKTFGYHLEGLDTRVYDVIPLVLKGQSIMYEVQLS